MNSSSTSPFAIVGWTVAILFVLVVVIGGGIGGCAGIKAFERAQKRADANNAVQITDIQIRNQNAYAKVITAHNATVSAQAYQRLLEAQGIRHAQDEISKTLTPLYIQHEAIQALEHIANSGRNSTIVYIPSGPGGVPLISQTPPATLKP